MGKGRLLLAIALSAIASAALSQPASSADRPGFSGSCSPRVIRDYKAFLDNLAPLAAVPFDQRLSFAPERVFFGSLGGGPLQAGYGIRGFRLSYSPSEGEAAGPTPELDWNVTATLTSIDKFGQPLAPPQTIEQHVDRLWPAGPGSSGDVRWLFSIPGEPAIYRLEIVFVNENGEQLAAFGEYFRVLKPSVDFRFSLNKKKFQPGETVIAKLSNYGVASLAFGLGKWVEYHNGTSWTKPPVEFGNGIVLAIRLHADPGTSKSCWSVTIPKNAPPGRYRLGTSIEVLKRPMPVSKNRRIVRASFTVLPDDGEPRKGN